jgi:hypothetical protein
MNCNFKKGYRDNKQQIVKPLLLYFILVFVFKKEGVIMSKSISIMLIIILLLSCLLTVSCGGSKTTTGTNQTPGNNPTTATSSGGSLDWSDMPKMAGSTEIQKGSWSIPPVNESDYSKMEWRYYDVITPMKDMANFYREQMPAKGWSENSWMDTPQTSWGLFNKNNGNDAAMVWISTGENGKTIIALWRASK